VASLAAAGTCYSEKFMTVGILATQAHLHHFDDTGRLGEDTPWAMNLRTIFTRVESEISQESPNMRGTTWGRNISARKTF
jgi:hypothetical protein